VRTVPIYVPTAVRSVQTAQTNSVRPVISAANVRMISSAKIATSAANVKRSVKNAALSVQTVPKMYVRSAASARDVLMNSVRTAESVLTALTVCVLIAITAVTAQRKSVMFAENTVQTVRRYVPNVKNAKTALKFVLTADSAMTVVLKKRRISDVITDSVPKVMSGKSITALKEDTV